MGKWLMKMKWWAKKCRQNVQPFSVGKIRCSVVLQLAISVVVHCSVELMKRLYMRADEFF